MATSTTRKKFLRTVAAGGTALAGLRLLSLAEEAEVEEEKKPAKGSEEEEKKPKVGPVEDLMREHGVISRVLLIYEESIRRLAGSGPFDPKSLAAAAGVVRRFIEDYHEKNEEEHVFPALEKKPGALADQAKVLRAQHEAGRKLTADILAACDPAAVDKPSLRPALEKFIRMYRPHKAREDTVVFPAFRSGLSAKEFDKLGEAFEKKERELFKEPGLEGIVNEVADIERSLGIHELSRFTP